MVLDSQTTVGAYLATRLEQIGLQHYFAVPGDYNLVLLDELLRNNKVIVVEGHRDSIHCVPDKPSLRKLRSE